jgi:hypothetical protein
MIPCISTQLWQPWNTNGLWHQRPPSKRNWTIVTCWPGMLSVVWFICDLCSTTTVFLAAYACFDVWRLYEDLITVLHSQAKASSCYVTCKQDQGSLNCDSTVVIKEHNFILKWSWRYSVDLLFLWNEHYIQVKSQNSKLKNYTNEMKIKSHKNHDNCQLTVTQPHHLPVDRDRNFGVRDIQVPKQCFP